MYIVSHVKYCCASNPILLRKILRLVLLAMLHNHVDLLSVEEASEFLSFSNKSNIMYFGRKCISWSKLTDVPGWICNKQHQLL